MKLRNTIVIAQPQFNEAKKEKDAQAPDVVLCEGTGHYLPVYLCLAKGDIDTYPKTYVGHGDTGDPIYTVNTE